MMEGKIPENVLKRSVLREVKNNKENVITGASFGEDCAVLNLCQNPSDTKTLLGSSVALGEGLLESKIAVTKACNNLYADGFKAEHILLSVTIPESFEEEDLKNLMKELRAVADKEDVAIVSGHTAISRSLTNKCLVSVTALGRGTALKDKRKVKPGDTIIVTKWIGIEGAYILANEYKEIIVKRFRDEFENNLLENSKYLSIKEEAFLAASNGVKYMKDVSEHGLFGALYEMAEVIGRGVSVNLRDIPVKQEIIELCNFLDINPYEMKSSGMLLMVTDDKDGLLKVLEDAGICAAAIGSISDDNDKVVINGEEKRFLEKIKQDSIYKINKTEGKGE